MGSLEFQHALEIPFISNKSKVIKGKTILSQEIGLFELGKMGRSKKQHKDFMGFCSLLLDTYAEVIY